MKTFDILFHPVPLKNGILEGGGVRNSIYAFHFFWRFWLFFCHVIDATGKGKDKWPKIAKTSFSPKPFIFWVALPRRARKHNQAPDSTTVPLSCALGPLVALPRRARKHNQKKNRVSKRIISGKKCAKVGDACIGEKPWKQHSSNC